ncbi:MAG: hypothetical protein KDA83_16045, partial [Planctomycetales bacterium]|nr:hypothetical protein [Planctomycetales bacterium]
ASMALPDFYKQAGEIIAERQSELTALEEKLTVSYARWEELEAKGSE